MAKFITLTGTNGFKPRVNVDHITSYAWNEERQVTAVDLSDGTYSVTETPAEIDALLGVTNDPLPAIAERAARLLATGLMSADAQVDAAEEIQSALRARGE